MGIKQGDAVLWLQPGGPGTEMIPYAAGEDGAAVTGKSFPRTGVAPVWGRDRFRKPVVISVDETPPGELPSVTIAVYEKKSLNVLEEMLKRSCPINMQIRFTECADLDDPEGWDKVTHLDRGVLTVYNPGDGPSIEYNRTLMQAAGTLAFRGYAILVENTLSDLTTGVADDVLAIAGIPDDICEDCGYGFPGADEFIVLGMEASGAGVPAEVMYSINRGGAFANITANPLANGENADRLVVFALGVEKARIIVGTSETAAGKAHFAWGDVYWGDEAATTWTGVTIAATANGDTIQAIGRLGRRVYFASAGDLYISTTQGKTDPGAAVATGATAYVGFSPSPDNKRMWAFGASNLLKVERNRSGTFVNRVGPTGGGTFHSFVEAADGTIYAGNGTALYKNSNQARYAGGWTLLQDFGANKSVIAIQLVKGSSQLLRLVVADSTPDDGVVYESIDGGATIQQITTLPNGGYTSAYFSDTDDNLALIGGLGGVVQVLDPVGEA